MIKNNLGVIPAGETKVVNIKADSSSSASTVEMSFHMLNISDHKAVRFYLKQHDTTVPSISKNQLPYKATCWNDGHEIFFEVSS